MTNPAMVKRTRIGPELSIVGVQVTSWFGTIHNDLADEIAADINIAMAVREAAKDATIARLSAELEAAREALEPFAAAASRYDGAEYDRFKIISASDSYFTIAQLRAARAACANLPKEA